MEICEEAEQAQRNFDNGPPPPNSLLEARRAIDDAGVALRNAENERSTAQEVAAKKNQTGSAWGWLRRMAGKDSHNNNALDSRKRAADTAVKSAEQQLKLAATSLRRQEADFRTFAADYRKQWRASAASAPATIATAKIARTVLRENNPAAARWSLPLLLQIGHAARAIREEAVDELTDNWWDIWGIPHPKRPR